MKRFQVVLLRVLLLVTGAFNSAVSRSLSDIRYRFTSCDVSGQHGPTIDQCTELYERTDSAIMRDDLFIDFSDDGNMLVGAQGFRIPRPGIYNITIAGAAGGRGVCNIHFGHGVVHEFQVNLSPKYELLILVGQKGIGPCDTNPTHFLCQRQPKSPENAVVCSERWYNWTRSLSSSEDFVYSFNGGAGGGGASMIWARLAENETFLRLPLFVSAGGGGSPAILDYDSVKADIETGIGTQFSRSQEAYNYHLNGRSLFISPGENATLMTRGNRGNRRAADATAGAGGGFMGLLSTGDTDGHPLSQQRSFAEGGNNCVNSALASFSNPNIFLDTVGGFGGGGGGCGGGGGGGGYTGGSVFNLSNNFPGSGGYSAAFSIKELGFPQQPRIPTYQNENNGFVEIVPADCGCSDECIVSQDTETFECLCRNENHTLAENGFDCYKQTKVKFEQVWTRTIGGYIFKGLQLSNISVLVFSVQLSFQLEVVDTDSAQSQCAIVFIDDENNPIFVTNTVRTGSSLIANQLSTVSIANNTISLSGEYYSLLEDPELVSGAVIVSDGNCSLREMAIPMNISTRKGIGQYAVDFDALLEQFNRESVRNVLQIQSTLPPPPESASYLNVGLIVGVVVALIAVLTILSLLILAIIGYWVQKSRRNKQSVVLTLSPNASNATLLPAVRYAEIDVPDVSPVAKYDIIENQKKDQAQGYSVVIYDNDFDDDGMYDLPRDPTMSTSQFSSKYGIIAPVHDFTQYNRGRIESETDNWQYPRSKLIYIRELGEGQFGKVLLMKAKGIAGFEGKIPVAVKTLTSRDPEVIDKFMEEAELMKKFNHPNIVSILGVSSKDDDDDDSAPLMILEYMPYGDLQNFLENHRSNELGQTSIKEKHFYSFATDIARALEFLTARKYVHRDVAARNCLVGPDLHIKIADFGMSRGVQDKEYYRVAGKQVLPVRWMSPEALLYGKFTAASDVWAFGVTVWEIVSFGETPLEDMDVQEIIQAAQNKSLEHDKPPGCPDDLYTLMCQCHIHDVDERIIFPDILCTLEDALNTASITTKPVAADQADQPEEEEKKSQGEE